MIGTIAWWTPPSTINTNSHNRGYGFIEVNHNGQLEKFFCLGSRLLFDSKPVEGLNVVFSISPDRPRRQNGYPLAENVKIATEAQAQAAQEESAKAAQ